MYLVDPNYAEEACIDVLLWNAISDWEMLKIIHVSSKIYEPRLKFDAKDSNL